MKDKTWSKDISNSDVAQTIKKALDELSPKQTDKWEDLIEKLADIEHQRWSDWQKYVHDKCGYSGKIKMYCIPTDLFDRWERQIRTDYKDLSEAEKDSDREQVKRYLPLIKQTLKSQEEDFKKVLREIVEYCYKTEMSKNEYNQIISIINKHNIKIRGINFDEYSIE